MSPDEARLRLAALPDKAVRQVLQVLRGTARKRGEWAKGQHRTNCGSVCLCDACAARQALQALEDNGREPE